MAGLGMTVADLLARAQAAASGGQTAALTPVATFGENPGGLRMWVHAPEDLPKGSPLVVVLHGCGQTAGGYAAGAGWIELADRHGFALLCPEQIRTNNPNGCFNWFEPGDMRRGAGEAASIAQMVRYAVVDLSLDARRVFVTGLSAGGAMAAVMLAAYPDLFAAGAIIAGLPYGSASDVTQALAAMRQPPALAAKTWGNRVRAAGPANSRWPRVSIWHGDADRTVSPAAAEALAQQWSEVHGAWTRVDTSTAVARHSRTTWIDASGAVAVELNRLAGLGHGTPICAGGADGCGAAAPWILEAGLSSSGEIVRFWQIDRAHSPRSAKRRPAAPKRPAMHAAAPSSPLASDPGETIASALRAAGLLR